MKLLLYPALLFALICSSCVKETSQDDAVNSLLNKIKQADKTKNGKVTICHATGSKSNPWVTIEISRSALDAHLKHGDINPDSDGDGYTAPAGVLNPCGSGTANDCNDMDATIYPGAKEVCGDGKDNNCDGKIDEGCPPVVREGSLTTAELTSGARWRNFRPDGAGWELAVGRNIGSAGQPWVSSDLPLGGNYFFSPSTNNNTFTFTYNATSGEQGITAQLNGPYTATINNGNLGAIDYLQITVSSLTPSTTVEFKDVVLTIGSNNYNLGSFTASGNSPSWYINDFDLSAGFTLTGRAVLTGASSNEENNRIDILIGRTP